MQLKPITENHLPTLWQLGYTETHPDWKKWDGPYFDDYQPLNWAEFQEKMSPFFLKTDVRGIFTADNKLIGMVSRHWEDKATRWLEIGIVIYQPTDRQLGLGSKALKHWITDTFATYPEIEHIGLTTWSGNIGMMRTAERIGLKLEAQIRKVRYWQGIYYDSVKYGILSDEWNQLL